MNSEVKNLNDFEAHVIDYQGLIVFRNNCGALTDATGRTVFYGVGGPSPRNRKGLGGSDFIGWFEGRFCAFEIKADNDNTDPERLRRQENFLRRVVEAGGLAGFVRRPLDIADILAGKGCIVLANYPKERLQNH